MPGLRPEQATIDAGNTQLRSMKTFAGLLALGMAMIHSMPAVTGAELAVKVENLSKPVLCAEEDNVTLMFTSPKVRRFRIEALHPAYLAGSAFLYLVLWSTL